MQYQHAPTASTTHMPIGHSNEIEHRLTMLEVFAATQLEVNKKMDKRLTLQERGLLLVTLALTSVAHEKLPEWAKLAAGVFKAMQTGG